MKFLTYAVLSFFMLATAQASFAQDSTKIPNPDEIYNILEGSWTLQKWENMRTNKVVKQRKKDFFSIQKTTTPYTVSYIRAADGQILLCSKTNTLNINATLGLLTRFNNCKLECITAERIIFTGLYNEVQYRAYWVKTIE